MPSSSAASSSPKLHFLLLPLPEQGHINPMLALASHLAAHGCTVTFVTAEKAPLAAAAPPPKANPDDPPAHALPLTPQYPLPQPATNGATSTNASTDETNTLLPNSTNLRFCTLRHPGHSSPASADQIAAERSPLQILKLTMAGLEEQQGMIEKIVQESKSSDAPITCIICDVFLCQLVMSLAKRQAVLAAAFVSCSGFGFYTLYLMQLGKGDEIEELHLRFGLMAPKQETKAEKGINNRLLEVITVFKKLFTGVEEASHVLVNSFEHLEPALLESVETSKLNIKFIGPCLPGWEAGDASGKVGNSMANQTGCLFSEDEACLPWLDKQEKGSVLFVSFGSEGDVEAEQVQELAMGIEGSGCKFLWVVRPDVPANNLPQEDFRERTHNVGMFVSWAPQKRVLQHPAVGGFLTHCGWNSILESMVFCVPMLCFPLNGDQFLNAQLIDERWKVGLRLGPPRTLVPRAEVERAVRDLMGNEDLRLRVVQLQQAANCAFHESQSSIISFVQDITNSVHQKLADIEKRESLSLSLK